MDELPVAPQLLKNESSQPPPPQINNASICIKKIGGIVCLIIMVIDWVAYAEILQTFDTGSFNHLFFIRYCAVSGFMLAIIPWYFTHHQSMKSAKSPQMELIQSMPVQIQKNDIDINQSLAGASYRSLPNDSLSIINLNDNDDEHTSQYTPLSVCASLRSMVAGMVFIGTASFLVGYTWYGSLDHTFVAANNTMYQSQCVFVLLFSSIILKTNITIMKMFAMVLAVGGVAMVSFGTTTESDDEIQPTWFGYVLCIVSTMLYAVQTVSTKYFGDKCFREKFQLADNFLLMFGMGLFVFLCFWPGFIILHFTGLEEFSLPRSYNDVMTVLLPVALDAVYTGSYMAGVMLLGPIGMSLGSLSVIPISFVADVWLHGLDVTMLAVWGSLLIFISFIVIEIPTNKVIGFCVQQNKERVCEE